MPRPPRTKVASRVTKPTKPKAAPRKQQAKASTTTSTKQPGNVLNTFSEDSDGLITKSKTVRARRSTLSVEGRETAAEVEFTMTGALPVESLASRTSTPASNTSKRGQTARAVTKTTTHTSSPVTSSAQTRRTTRSMREEAVQAEDSSGLGDTTFSSLGSDSPAHGTRPPSAIKVGAIPAHERSILALTNFKRRARQPSLLRMVQQTTDVEDNDRDDLDDTGNFDFDDFLPQAESTPLNIRKNPQEDETRNDSGTHISSSGSRGTKRKLSPVVQVPRSSPPISPTSGADVESVRSTSPSLPEILPSHEEVVGQTQDDSDVYSETFAPPKSSSPVYEAPPPVQSPIQKRPRRTDRRAKTPIQDESSEGEATETPAKPKRGAGKKKEPVLSTAQLKGLLPRRRNRRRDHDEFDLESSDEIQQIDSDQDELQMPMRRTKQRQGTGAGKLTSPKATKKSTRGKKVDLGKTAHRTSRTYSRRVASDKENEAVGEGEEDTAQISAIEHSEKLAAIRKKFEEVDAFELEFETVDVTTSSSPFR